MNSSRQEKGNRVKVAMWSSLEDRIPVCAIVANVDLIVIRHDDQVSVLYGRCLHRGALMADGRIEGDHLVCGVHGRRYRSDTGQDPTTHDEGLHEFNSWVDLEADAVLVDELELREWEREYHQPYDRGPYLGQYADFRGSPEEPTNNYIQRLARDGLKDVGPYGVVSAMGVPFSELPRWSDIQILTAQVARAPLSESAEVKTELVIGPSAARPLRLDIPIFISDMSVAALSPEAKVALAMGAERAGTGICSGEGGVLVEEQAASSKYLYELPPRRARWSLDRVARCHALHFQVGQGARTGLQTRPPMPGDASLSEFSRDGWGKGVGEGSDRHSISSVEDFIRVADEVREVTGGIPIGFKMSAQHLEADIDFALEVGVDYIILDGRGGSSGATPNILRDNISIPTIAALARARRHLNSLGKRDVTLIATGGLRTESDFVKAIALGADGIAIGNAALQAIGCLSMRACHTQNCPVGIATQKEELRARLDLDKSSERLYNYLSSTVELMKVLARACAHRHLNRFCANDLTTWKRDVAYLAGISYAGVTPLLNYT